MKKTVLVSAILTIALCLGAVVGSTFALFTDSTDVSIVVSSGNVEVDASLAIGDVYSAVASTTAGSDFLVDAEHSQNYTHVVRTDKKFSNGGTASISQEGVLEIKKITPGDKVDVNLVVENAGDVAMIYCIEITANDGALVPGMVVTVGDDAYEGLKSYTSKWSDRVASGADPINVLLSFELPIYAGDEYQSETEAQEDGRLAGEKAVEYTIVVKAVQGNAKMDANASLPSVTFYNSVTP